MVRKWNFDLKEPLGHLIGTQLRTPALKTENFSKKLSRFSKPQKWIYQNALLLIFPGSFVQGTVLVNPFLHFTKTTDFFTEILGFKGRGLRMTSDLRI